MARRIVVFGATGHTGRLAAEALVAAGSAPLLAGRDPAGVAALAGELGGLEH
nr:saccharopine dehydrogenase [Solirubrobacterales bacterium]